MNEELKSFLPLLRQAGPLSAYEVVSAFIHRLNNFLFIVSGRIEMCGESPEEKTETIAAVQKQLEKLKTSIKKYEHIKDVCQPDKSSNDFLEIAGHVVDLYHADAQKKKCSIDIAAEEDRYLSSFDPFQMSYAMFHVLDNALAGSAPSGKVLINFTRNEKGFAVEVINDIASDKEALNAEMADIFYSTKASAAGLGLGVVKRILRSNDVECSLSAAEGRNIVKMSFTQGT